MKINASEFDDKFDNGEDITEYLDLPGAMRLSDRATAINMELPEWIVDSLDRESKRLGTSRGAIIKIWLAERLKTASKESDEPSSGQ